MPSRQNGRNNSEFKEIGAIIEKFFSSDTISGVMAYAPIWNEWPALVGANLAETLKPKYVQYGRLHVSVSGHAMVHRVQLQKHAILNNINSRLAGVQLTEIVFDL